MTLVGGIALLQPVVQVRAQPHRRARAGRLHANRTAVMKTSPTPTIPVREARALLASGESRRTRELVMNPERLYASDSIA